MTTNYNAIAIFEKYVMLQCMCYSAKLIYVGTDIRAVCNIISPYQNSTPVACDTHE
jgi:hypothetical protein